MGKFSAQITARTWIFQNGDKRMLRLLAAFVAAACIATFSIEVWKASRHQIQYAEKQKHGRETDQEARKLLADERIANYTLWLAILTGALVGAALAQGYFLLRADTTTRISAEAARDSVQTAKDYLERAYIFGGCGSQDEKVENARRIKIVTATHGNYGKTPGFVERVFIAHCLERDLPTKPIYRNPIAVNDPLPPTGHVKVINRTTVEFDVTHGQIYYGRIIYLDVFKIRHHSSFIYRFYPDWSHEPVSGVDPEYWHWGKDPDQS